MVRLASHSILARTGAEGYSILPTGGEEFAVVEPIRS
jgi:hypothetical protein